MPGTSERRCEGACVEDVGYGAEGWSADVCRSRRSLLDGLDGGDRRWLLGALVGKCAQRGLLNGGSWRWLARAVDAEQRNWLPVLDGWC